MDKANNVIRIPTSLDSKFFRYWFEFLSPFHKLSNREMDVITSFVKHRHDISKLIKDDNILDQVTMSDDIKAKVRADCNITISHFQAILSKLRKNKIIVNGVIDSKFIPHIKEDHGVFQLLLIFELE